MKVQLAYGRSGLNINLPEQSQVVVAPFTEGIYDPMTALTNAIRQPINSSEHNVMLPVKKSRPCQ